jgi:hypothetical protein
MGINLWVRFDPLPLLAPCGKMAIRLAYRAQSRREIGAGTGLASLRKPIEYVMIPTVLFNFLEEVEVLLSI